MKQWITALCATVAMAPALPAAAQSGAQDNSPQTVAELKDLTRAQADELAEVKRQLSVVINEMQTLRQQSSVAETDKQLESANGLGPAASKVYGGQRSHVSLGGYLEGNYARQVGDAKGNGRDTADILRSVIYLGYKFSDKIVFNSEVEIESTTTAQNGTAELELGQLDFLLTPSLNIRAGLLLAPLGFINEVHEPPFYLGNIRPEPELRIIPSTFREEGVGIFGTFGESFTYRAYVMNAFDAGGFSSRGLAGGKQNGSQAQANSLAFVGRFDYEPLEGLQVGGSLYQGNTGQDRDDLPDAQTRLWEAHAQFRRAGLQFRALYTQADVDDADVLSQRRLDLALPDATVAERMIGGYGEIGYDIMQWLRPGSEATLVPFFRLEYTDTQNKVPRGFMVDRAQTRRIFVPGLQYKPLPNVVVKVDYRNIDPFEGNAPDELRFGIGLAF